MTLAKFESSVSPEMDKLIKAQINNIAAKHDVRILFAIESGSRAWGFPSPDSDYDVRFVYAHPVDWYLSIFPGRDVIELPIEGDLDINGWDLRKGLGLLLKPNPVMLEWLSSPIRYVWNDEVCQKLIAFSNRVTHRSACLHHYLNLAQSHWVRHAEGRDEINFKKYLYILRPALAIRWIRLRPDTSPPMNLQAMVDGVELPEATVDEIARLLELKSKANEIGTGARIAAIDALIDEEIAWAQTAAKGKERNDLAAVANALFRDILGQVWDD